MTVRLPSRAEQHDAEAELALPELTDARFWTYALWALVACVYTYLVAHVAGQQGFDFVHLFSGPHATVHGEAPYPTSSHPNEYFDSGRPYYIMPPAAPIVLAPLGLLSEHAAWIVFSVPMVLLAPLGLAAILRQLRPSLPWLPPLAALLVALFVPYQLGTELGNLDLFLAGVTLCGIALLLRGSPSATLTGALLIGVAVALKPTLWPLALVVLAAVPMRARIAMVAAAAVPTLVGLLVIPAVDRFFNYVLPQLREGEPEIDVKRQALGDLARTTSLPDGLITNLSLLLTAALTIAVIALCRRRQAAGYRRRYWALAPLGVVVPLALFLAPYGFAPYSIYLLAALPFALLAARPWAVVAAALGTFLVGAEVALGFGGGLSFVPHWRFLVGLGLLSLVVLAGLRDLLRGEPVLGFATEPR